MSSHVRVLVLTHVSVFYFSVKSKINFNACILLEECAGANPDARIRLLTHVSVDRAYQAKSVGSNSLLSILIAIRRSPNL